MHEKTRRLLIARRIANNGCEAKVSIGDGGLDWICYVTGQPCEHTDKGMCEYYQRIVFAHKYAMDTAGVWQQS